MDNGKLVPPKKCTVQEWIQYQYFNRFGSKEFKEKFSGGEMDWCNAWWKKNVVESELGVISLGEFKEWFYHVHKKKPRRFETESFVTQMILHGAYLSPRTFEEAEEIRITRENNGKKESTGKLQGGVA